MNAWLLVPYMETERAGRVVWKMPIHRQDPNLLWSESEIPGKRKRAVVRVRGLGRHVMPLKRKHHELTDAEAVRLIATSPHKPLGAVLDETRFRSRELTQLTGLWRGIGFGEGWRVPQSLCDVLAKRIGEPTQYWRDVCRLRFLGIAGAAFPTTSVLDNFNRTDEDPLSDGGNWSGPLRPAAGGFNTLRVASNLCARASSGNQYGQGYRSNTTYGLDSECFVTITTTGTGTLYHSVFCSIVSPNTAGVDAYECYSSGSTTAVERIDNNSSTEIVSTSQSRAAGNKQGVENLGTAIAMYWNSGSWSQIGTTTDTTYNTGNIGCQIDGTAARMDDFGGGTVVSGPTPINATPSESFLLAEAFTGRRNFRAIISENLEN